MIIYFIEYQLFSKKKMYMQMLVIENSRNNIICIILLFYNFLISKLKKLQLCCLKMRLNVERNYILSRYVIFVLGYRWDIFNDVDMFQLMKFKVKIIKNYLKEFYKKVFFQNN